MKQKKGIDISDIFTGENQGEVEELYKAYIEYVKSQKSAFLAIVTHTAKCIDTLSKEGRIGNNINITARIKSPISALRNDVKNINAVKTGKRKDLDDVFGIEIVASEEKELEIIKRLIEKYMDVLTTTEHNKPNGYVATHAITRLKISGQYISNQVSSSNIPDIEIQCKTFEVSKKATIGSAAHTAYKEENVEEIKKEIEQRNI